MALNYNIQLAIFNILICVDSQSVLYALQNWDCKARRDIVYEVKYLIHCIIFRGIGVLNFDGYPLIVVSIGMNYQIN